MSLAEIFDYLWSLVVAAWHYPIPWSEISRWIGGAFLLLVAAFATCLVALYFWSILQPAWSIISDGVDIAGIYFRRIKRRLSEKSRD